MPAVGHWGWGTWDNNTLAPGQAWVKLSPGSFSDSLRPGAGAEGSRRYKAADSEHSLAPSELRPRGGHA